MDEGEGYLEAAMRGLREELGVSNVSLKELKKIYTEEKVEKGNAKRYAMLYTATYAGAISPDANEVAEVKWMLPQEIRASMEKSPDDFTYAFKEAFKNFSGARFDAMLNA